MKDTITLQQKVKVLNKLFDAEPNRTCRDYLWKAF